MVSVFAVWAAVWWAPGAAAATGTFTEVAALHSVGFSAEFHVTAQSSDDGSVVAFRAADPSLPTAPAFPQLFVWHRDTGLVQLASSASDGTPGDGEVFSFSLSGDGRYVVFGSSAANLDPRCLSHSGHCVYRKDLQTGQLILAAIRQTSYGNPFSASLVPSISSNGRFVVWATDTGIVGSPSNGLRMVAEADLDAGTAWAVSLTPAGNPPNNSVTVGGTPGGWDLTRQMVSDDGRYVVMQASDNDMVTGDTNNRLDVFLADTVSGTIKKISTGLGGAQTDRDSEAVEITPDGRTVLFQSTATNLTSDGVSGFFTYDVATGVVALASIGADGAPAFQPNAAAITDDGRYVLFSDPMTLRDLHTGISQRITDPGALSPFGGFAGDWDLSGDGTTVTGAGTITSPGGSTTTGPGVFVLDAATTINRDTTRPVVVGMADRQPNAAGWYRAPVTITWTATDPPPSSGPPTTPPPTTLSTEGTGQTVTSVQACDPAGNCATGTYGPVNLDLTPPTVTIGGVTDGTTYPIGQAPAATCTASDALSGLAAPCTLTVTGGAPDGSGAFTVTATATDSAGNTGQASVSYQIPAPTAPATPMVTTVVTGDHSATISWLKPDDGGSPILGYTVTATPGGLSCSTDSPDALSCTITGLTNGINYTFTVTARNTVGTSPPSGGGGGGSGGGGNGSGTGTPGEPPAPPGGPMPVPSPDGTQVTLTWLAAASDPNLPVIGYRATADPGGQFCTIDGALSCTITHLDPNVDYTFTVIAINGIGSSDPSLPVGTPPTVTGISPSHGPAGGGTTVTITGTHLTGATTVMFGTSPATAVTVLGDTSLTAVAPAAMPDTVDITVTTQAGTSPTSPADHYSYDPAADLSVAVTASATTPALGDAYTQTMTVTNAGPSPATAITTSVTFTGANATPIGATLGCSISGHTVTCPVGSLAAGAFATISVTVEPDAAGTITTTATASANEADPAPGNNTASQNITVTNAHGCTITGTPGNDTLTGTNGNDIICALGGDDHVTGGNGDDTIYGGSGTDYLDGGNGNDTIYAGNTGSTLLGGNGNDTLIGGAGNDTIYGDNGDDTITAGAGNDTIQGGNGNDIIDSGDGNDSVDGGNGNDTCPHTEHPTSCTP